ncbi:hypothetical protein EMPG_17271 [Blastomyces silverae]|uniref:Uncharacterized protein n=1 Tax=Blastomyces silverae TaxID=2060906 RepID=A0A0H1B756_9EURO|nr:hypothetical protein EMPG_17271 [Blastomyces silverae]
MREGLIIYIFAILRVSPDRFRLYHGVRSLLTRSHAERQYHSQYEQCKGVMGD